MSKENKNKIHRSVHVFLESEHNCWSVYPAHRKQSARNGLRSHLVIPPHLPKRRRRVSICRVWTSGRNRSQGKALNSVDTGRSSQSLSCVGWQVSSHPTLPRKSDTSNRWFLLEQCNWSPPTRWYPVGHSTGQPTPATRRDHPIEGLMG